MRNKLRAVMTRKHMRVVDLARLTKVHYSKISRIRHNVEDATPKQKLSISKVLGYGIQEIFPDGKSKAPVPPETR